MALSFARNKPATLLVTMLFRIEVCDVPAPSTMPAPNWFALVWFRTVNPSIVTSSAVTRNEVLPAFPCTIDSGPLLVLALMPAWTPRTVRDLFTTTSSG